VELPAISPLITLDEDCGYNSKQKGLTPAERAGHYSIDDGVRRSAPDIVVRFDGVLTTGSHFKGIEIVLGERFPGVTVFGLFFARAMRPPNDETFDLDF
jgi:hypothetical protein